MSPNSDVYKRQTKSGKFLHHCRGQNHTGFYLVIGIYGKETFKLGAVSYTHLDVYKRQGIDLAILGDLTGHLGEGIHSVLFMYHQDIIDGLLCLFSKAIPR